MTTQAGNWVAESCSTLGTGDIILAGAATGQATFSGALAAGDVFYSIEDGTSRECGIGTYDGASTIVRGDIRATLVNGIYTKVSPLPITLTGTAVVSCTYNASAYEDVVQYAIDAEASELASAASAAAALVSETNAAASATAASSSASSAASSASSAAGSATTATTSASNAATSASNAATSETNASNSASAASTSATNAATSESNAATSATNAASSASAAATSATEAAASAASIDTSSFVVKSNNLSDLDSASTALTNLGIANHDNITVNTSGHVTVPEMLNVTSSSSFGHIEVGGPSGAYIDLKAPASDDYDARIITSGSGLNITTNAGVGAVMLQHEGATKLATTSTGISVTGSVTLGNWSVTQSGTDLVFATGGTNKMKLDASGNLTVVGDVTAFGTV